MKIKPEHLNHIKSEIAKMLDIRGLDYDQLVDQYEGGNFPRADKVKDLQMRFCFDIFWAAGLTKYSCDVLYNYLNDDHIYTALRSVCPKVVRKY